VLLGAGLLSLIAGVTLEAALDSLSAFPALLVLVPPFLSSTGAVGGILSSRLTSKLHLGLVEPSALPARAARADIGLAYVVAVVVFALGSVVADLTSYVVSLGSPGPVDMLLVSVVGGLLATTFAVAIGYYTAILTFRVGLDPDNYAIPMVSSSLDLLGAISFILAVALFVGSPS
jgi:mgtE-like transporter